MKNPVYWAVLLGMSVLLMEQGKGIAGSGALYLHGGFFFFAQSLCAYI